MISGPRGHVCNSHYVFLLPHSGLEDHHHWVGLGAEVLRACSDYSHRIELSFKTDESVTLQARVKGALQIFKHIFCIIRLMSDVKRPDQPPATPREFHDVPASEV